MKKTCIKKCKKCKGVKCPNYSKVAVDNSSYYEGVLHSKAITFRTNEDKKWSELYKEPIRMRRYSV